MDGKNELILQRVFNAPRKIVFEAFTKSEHLNEWWGPKGFTMHTVKLDLRPGGIFHYRMKSPEGFQMWGKFVYREIIKPEKMVFVVSFSDEHGGITRHPMSATWPLEVLNTLTLEEENGKTTLTLRGAPINASEEEIKTFESNFPGMEQGFKGTFDQLEEFLAKAH
jgi:uncharacterized protein YndB with AHSA1/START domain